MTLYKTSKGPGIALIIVAALFAALGVILLTNPDDEDYLVLCVLLFILGAIILVLGIVVLVTPTRTVQLVDEKLVFNNFKYEAKNSSFADETKKILTIPTNDIVDFQVQGQSKTSSFLAGFLGGAIGAAIAGSKNPDKLIVKTKDSQVVVFIPQLAGNKIKNGIKLEKEQEELKEKLDTIEPMKSLDEEE